jgi:lysophospholipid acyltransferase (LPLAT)-like uncharacterized protein
VPKRSKRILHRLLQWLGPWIIRLIGLTLRIERVNPSAVDELSRQGKPFILCVWHGRLFLPVYYHRQQDIVAMVSQHADGELISRIIAKLGYGTVRGSSTRGGKEAFYQMLAHLRGGGIGAMIPDGPTGPKYQLKAGVMMLAQQAECPLIPITYAARPCLRFKTWDGMVLPRPFSRTVLCYGDPIMIPAQISSAELESERLKVEQTMLDLVRMAEERLGYTFNPHSSVAADSP